MSPEDDKLVTLARAARARTGAAEGAAVRDTDGRTYAAATVALPSLRLSALQVAVAMAACSGADGLEAAAVVGAVVGPVVGPVVGAVVHPAVGPAAVDAAGLAAVRDLSADAPVYLTAPDGTVVDTA